MATNCPLVAAAIHHRARAQMTVTFRMTLGLVLTLVACAGASTQSRTPAPSTPPLPAAMPAAPATPGRDAAQNHLRVRDGATPIGSGQANAPASHEPRSVGDAKSTPSDGQGHGDAHWNSFVETRLDHLRTVAEKIRAEEK
jgi:hypothetical protein